MILNVQYICSCVRPQPAPAGGAGVTRQLLSALCAAPSPGPPQWRCSPPRAGTRRAAAHHFSSQPCNHVSRRCHVHHYIHYHIRGYCRCDRPLSVQTLLIMFRLQEPGKTAPTVVLLPVRKILFGLLSCEVWSVKCGVWRQHK